MAYKQNSIMDCGYYFVHPVTGEFCYVPPGGGKATPLYVDEDCNLWEASDESVEPPKQETWRDRPPML